MDEILENTLANRFAWMMGWFCKKMAAEGHARRVDGPVVVAAWGRFGRLRQRFAALIEQWQAGTLPVVVPKQPRVAVVRVAKARPPGLVSRGVNWLRKLFPDTATPLAGYLNQLVEGEPEIRALAAATPEAGRILRSMCHAVGFKPAAWLRLPRKPRGPRKVKPIPENETDEQADRRVARMSERAFINLLTPETEFLKGRPPHSVGYGRSGPWVSRLPKRS
jgi:hypothetical protein